MLSLKSRQIDFLFLLKILFVPILLELVVGGSGHFTEVGPLTARMVFFLFAMFASFVYYTSRRVIKKDVVNIIFLLTVIILFDTVVGYMNDAPVSAILEDLKLMSFFYILLFFSTVVTDINDIKRIGRILKIGSILLSVIYILVIILLALGKINFAAFYTEQNEIGEIMFRNEVLFFYKGFIYLCIGFFFFLLSKGIYNKLGALFLLVSVVLTLTRGLILFTFFIFIYYIFFLNRNIIYKILLTLGGIVLCVIALPIFFDNIGDKSGSDGMRYLQLNEVMSDVNPLSFIIGHGLGVGVKSRPVHMELSFLEIFHKQGLIGVCFWLGIFAHIFLMYFNIKDKSYKELALPFLLSVIFVILQSTTNPYMNNPIGLTIILITIVVFSKLLELQKEAVR